MKNARYFSPQGLFPIEWPNKGDSHAGASFDLADLNSSLKKISMAKWLT